MASFAHQLKRKHPSKDKDSIITVKQEHETGDSFITLNHPPHQTTITVKQENQTGDSIITLKHQHQTEDSIITTIKHENLTGDSIITLKKQRHRTGKDSFITVKVAEMCGRVEDFLVKRDEPLQQLKVRWKNRAGMEDYETFRFYFDGRAIHDDDNKTADDIGLKDGDFIHVMLVQTGS